MENRELATRYAKTLMELDPEGTAEADVNLLFDSLHRSHHIIMVFLEPMVSSTVKLNAIRKAFGPMNPKLSEFLDFIHFKNRLDHLPLILALYLHLRRKKKGIVLGHIRSALVLDENQIHFIEDRIGEKIKKHCIFDASVDSRLISGFTVQVEDTVIDCSVRCKIDGIRNRFMNLAG